MELVQALINAVILVIGGAGAFLLLRSKLATQVREEEARLIAARGDRIGDLEAEVGRLRAEVASLQASVKALQGIQTQKIVDGVVDGITPFLGGP